MPRARQPEQTGTSSELSWQRTFLRLPGQSQTGRMAKLLTGWSSSSDGLTLPAGSSALPDSFPRGSFFNARRATSR